MPVLSIIMPVFNAERTLRQAVDSVIGQCFEDWELILVDDGSRDGSGVICDSFSDTHEKIRTFHQENRGLSAARNTGLLHSVGQFVAFLDSDDLVEPDYYRRMVNAMEASGCGMVMSGYIREFLRDDVCRKRMTVTFESRRLELSPMTESDPGLVEFWRSDASYNLFIHVWNKLYRREVLRQAELCFNELLDFAEDVPFNVAYLQQIGSVCITAWEGYHYICKNQGNLTARWSEGLIEANGRTWRIIRDFLQGKTENPELSLADGMYLRGCFLNLEKALTAGQTYRQLVSAVRRTRKLPETREVLCLPPAYRDIFLEFLLYRGLLKWMPAFLICAAVYLRRSLKRRMGRL